MPAPFRAQETALKRFAHTLAAAAGFAFALSAQAAPVLSYNGHDYYYSSPASD